MVRTFTCLLIFIFCSLYALHAEAQRRAFGSRIGVYGGVTNYFGDINTLFLEPNEQLRQADLSYASYGVSYEKMFTPGFSAKLLYSRGQFITNDRKSEWDGTPDPEASNYARSLNARTELDNFSFLLSYSLADGYFLKENAFISPYIAAGLGLTHFQVYGDLLNSQGERYYYWSDNSIRNMPENTANPQQALIVRQDGVYETNLNELDTEEDYPTTVLTIPVSTGMRFRVSDALSLQLDYTLHYTFTDYLDDVSGNYRKNSVNETQQYAANPTGVLAESRGSLEGNDWFGFASLSLQFSFGKKEKPYRTPPIRTVYKPEEKKYYQAPKPLPKPETKAPETGSFLPDAPEMQPEAPARIPNVDSPEVEIVSFSKEEALQPEGLIENRQDTLSRLRYEIQKQSMENELYRLKVEGKRLRGENNPSETNRASQSSQQLEETMKEGAADGADSLPPAAVTAVQSPVNALTSPDTSAVLIQIKRVSQDSLPLTPMASPATKAEEEPNEALPNRLDSLERRIEKMQEQPDGKQNREAKEERIEAAEVPEEADNPITSENNPVEAKEQTRQQPSMAEPAREEENTGSEQEQNTIILTTAVKDSSGKTLQSGDTLTTKPTVFSASKGQASGRQADSLQVALNQLKLQISNAPVPAGSKEEQEQTRLLNQLQQQIDSLTLMLLSLSKSEENSPERAVIEFPETAVFFAVGSSSINSADARQLENVAAFLKKYPQARLLLHGYTDTSGPKPLNMQLSEQRAQSVKDEISQYGVAEERINTSFHGPDTKTSQNPAYGRRVDISFLWKEE